MILIPNKTQKFDFHLKIKSIYRQLLLLSKWNKREFSFHFQFLGEQRWVIKEEAMLTYLVNKEANAGMDLPC